MIALLGDEVRVVRGPFAGRSGTVIQLVETFPTILVVDNPSEPDPVEVFEDEVVLQESNS